MVCSLVEMSDELLVKSLWAKYNPPAHVKLDIVRIAGTGKRDGLAYGFRAISRMLPDENAVVAVIDGDTVLGDGVVRKTVPWLKLFPNVPTFAEQGFTNPLYRMNAGWIGIVAPAGTPAAAVRRLEAEYSAAVHQPEVNDKLIEMGLDPIGANGEAPTYDGLYSGDWKHRSLLHD